jgi:uncharacterized BrkB/YihY/UPF0761 family membrane protein
MSTTSGIGPLVTASSVMLGAFGFFYGSSKDRIAAAHDVGAPAADPVAWRRQVATVRAARTSARTLGAVAIVIWVLFLKAVVDELEAAWDVRFSPAHYQPLDVVFVALASAWLVIGVLTLAQAHALSATLATLERARPPDD